MDSDVGGFVADVVTTGTVHGLGPDATPEETEAVLGSGYAETRSRDVMWRDWGLVEFHWSGDGGRFLVQMHRLDATPQFAELRRLLEERGVDLVKLPERDTSVNRYWQPETEVSIVVVDGRVEKLSAPLRAEHAAVAAGHALGKRLDQALGQLVSAPEPVRQRWLDRRVVPAAGANWWLHLLVVAEHRIRRSDPADDWVLLFQWILAEADRRGGLEHREVVIKNAYVLAEWHRRGDLRPETLDRLPSPDDMVRACLALLPITIGEARVPVELSHQNLPAMRASRRAKNLVSAAQCLQDLLTDPELAAELAPWIEVRPTLV